LQGYDVGGWQGEEVRRKRKRGHNTLTVTSTINITVCGKVVSVTGDRVLGFVCRQEKKGWSVKSRNEEHREGANARAHPLFVSLLAKTRQNGRGLSETETEGNLSLKLLQLTRDRTWLHPSDEYCAQLTTEPDHGSLSRAAA
jgi:hypothetical protein